jgi:myo-inositol-1(or 4)-monophosphatase
MTMAAVDEAIESDAFEAAGTWGREAIRMARERARLQNITFETKHDEFDLTTPADGAIERYLVKAITERFPGHAILGEEGGAVAGNESWQWVIDPIDGTFNYATGLPGSACSVALLLRGQARIGVLADLASGMVVRAWRARGLVGDTPGWVFDPDARRDGPARSRLFLEYGGEGFDVEMLAALSQLAAVRPIVPRMVGSAAIALLAATLKGGSFVGVGLRLWDVAAGVLLAEEAGLVARWWPAEPPMVHVLVGEATEVEAFGPVVADLARRWEPLAARLLPAAGR